MAAKKKKIKRAAKKTAKKAAKKPQKVKRIVPKENRDFSRLIDKLENDNTANDYVDYTELEGLLDTRFKGLSKNKKKIESNSSKPHGKLQDLQKELAEEGARNFVEGRRTIESDEKWFSDADWRKGISENKNSNSKNAAAVYAAQKSAVVDDLEKMLQAKNSQHKLELLEEKIANKTRDFLKARRELLILRSALAQAYEKINIEDITLFQVEGKDFESLFDGRMY